MCQALRSLKVQCTVNNCVCEQHGSPAYGPTWSLGATLALKIAVGLEMQLGSLMTQKFGPQSLRIGTGDLKASGNDFNAATNCEASE